MRLHTSTLLLGLFALSACKDDPRYLTGKVTDVFGQPIEGATILVEGWEGARATSDGAGAYQLEAVNTGVVKLVAGAEGFVKDFGSGAIPVDVEAEIPGIDFSLWNKPEQPGFYAKGAGELVHLAASKVTATGTDLTELHGVRDIPDFSIALASADEYLFGSTLRSSEITQLNLKVFSLKFLEGTTIKGITGEEDIETKFWVADVERPFTLRSLYADDTFVIAPDEAFAAGVYAFVSQDILVGTEPGSLDKKPEEMRVVYPFEVK